MSWRTERKTHAHVPRCVMGTPQSLRCHLTLPRHFLFSAGSVLREVVHLGRRYLVCCDGDHQLPAAAPLSHCSCVRRRGLDERQHRILHDLRGDSGLRRLDRDVLAQPGVTHAIVMLGTNDLRNRNAKPEEEVTGAQMIAGMQQMAARAQACGMKFIAATLTPFGNETYMLNAWNPVREQHRVALNTWLRTSGVVDGVVDFDAALRDPACPTQMLAHYDCGDGLHPSDRGYCALGDAVDLALLG